ncbi:beta-mannosidase-like isoform X2 [Lineus longissimus]|uniref:beta-mannosidase-like isoform X2 n=1 Tax=Lineus longissimus TaxID=88925 RepID=UPI00315DD396
MLQGTYINYFHCLRIVDLLKETEAGSKNMFGRSQRMKGNKIKSELLSLVKHLPAEFDKITTATRDLKEPVNLYEMFIEFTLKKSTILPSMVIFEAETSTMLGQLKREDYMIEITVQDEASVTLASNFYFLTVPKAACGMRKANIKVKSVTARDKNFVITLSSDQPALFVFVEAWGIKGRFSQNGFHMMSGPSKALTLVFYPWEVTTVRALQDSLRITSLMDVYQF